VPLLVYVLGGLLVGPYEGENGILSFMGSIYVDALTAHFSAWFLLFSPLLLAGIWIAVLKLRQYTL
jgi:hypothetical protein